MPPEVLQQVWTGLVRICPNHLSQRAHPQQCLYKAVAKDPVCPQIWPIPMAVGKPHQPANCKFPKHPFGKKKVVSSVLECFLTAWKFPGFVQTLKYSHLLHSLSMLPAWWMKFKLESNMLLSGRRQTTSLGLLWSPHNARTAVWI